MLAIFHKSVAHPPQELHSPAGSGRSLAKNPDEILRDFHASHPNNSLSANFTGGAALAAVTGSNSNFHQRLFCSLDDVFCVFVGRLDNLCEQIRQYGLCKNTNEALLVIEAYRTLRDRGPYPADQVVKDLTGCFSFVVYDNKSHTVFAAQSSDGGIPMYWGIAADSSVVISDDLETVKAGCAKSFAPFPTGCMFHSEGGLRSYEHPMHRMKAMPRVDSEGVMCGAVFKVDKYSRINSMPRTGSSANWSTWDETEAC